MKTVPVSLGERSYEIRIANGLLDRTSEHLGDYARNGRLVVVSDENVWRAQGERLRQGLGSITVEPLIIKPGEMSKSWGVLSDLIERLIALEVERGDHIVAFGGGVVGDLAGFAAAILHRGIGVVQLPTSLLAQVDSSVGGKTAINTATAKNLVGAFHQPSLVLIDPVCLDTLDARQLRAGYAEIVKYALIEDADFFDWLEENGEKMIAGDRERQIEAIGVSVAGKAKVVAEDEREAGRRGLLNLGHTFGHALEADTGFSDRLLHGEAVGAGLILAFDFSQRRGLCAPDDAERVRDHLAQIGLGIPEIAVSGDTLVDHMRHDKKRQDGRIPFILVRGIGEAFIDRDVDLDDVAAFLDEHFNA